MSEMARYVLFCQTAPPRTADLALIRATPGITVLDETDGRALLVEGTAQGIRTLTTALSQWTIAPERIHPLS